MTQFTIESINKYVKLILILIFIHLFVVFFFKNIDALIQVTEEISMQSFSILIGIIIGAVAILITSITGLQSLLLNIYHLKNIEMTEYGKKFITVNEVESENKNVSFSNNIELQKIENKVSSNLDSIVLEIKDDVMWLIRLYIINIIIMYFQKIQFSFNLLPESIYSIYYPFVSRKAILTSLNILVIFLGVYIIIDIVSCIFTIYQTHMLAINEEFKENKKTKHNK